MALVEELLAPGADGVVDLFALRGELRREVVDVAELAFELFEAEEELRELLVGSAGATGGAG